jgi:hypothetical protein
MHFLGDALVVLLILTIVGAWPRRRYMRNAFSYRPATIASVLLLVIVLLVLFGYL